MQSSHNIQQANVARASGLLKAISNKTRLSIVCLLAENEMSVGELLDVIPLSQSAMSQHLALLRRGKIVKTRRQAQSIIYSLSSSEAKTIVATVHKLFCDDEN
ncbi:MAG: ArsR family transcriptional regulator [Acidimicrobiales bacterium]|nr:winged helix-turn-helix transcriptional regulator [Hyphomonadaceae bacterium]RZV44204.1 MAG: ArsR family transcriptional regulator [Acidimicrobiales bacterium]